MTGELRIPFIFKASFDKANRSSRASFRGPGHRGRPQGLVAGARTDRRAGAHRRARRYAARRGRRGGRCAADAGLPLPADQFHRRRLLAGQAGEHQEGPVPVALGNAERGRQGALHRQYANHGVRARILLRLQQSGVGHALPRRHARHRMPGGIRRHALGAAARRQGRLLRRAAGIRAGAGARRGRRGGGGNIHGNASRIRPRRCRMGRMPGPWIAWHRCWHAEGIGHRGEEDNPSRNHCYESDRRYSRPPNHRFARQSHGRGGRGAGFRHRRPGGGALGRLDRLARGGGVARRRYEALRRQGRAQGRGARQRAAARCDAGFRRPGSTRARRADDQVGRHGLQIESSAPMRFWRCRWRRRTRPRAIKGCRCIGTWRRRRFDSARAHDEHHQRRRARGQQRRHPGIHDSSHRRAVLLGSGALWRRSVPLP